MNAERPGHSRRMASPNGMSVGRMYRHSEDSLLSVAASLKPHKYFDDIAYGSIIRKHDKNR